MKWKKYSVILISAIALIISEQIIYACGGAYYYYPHNAQFFGKIADKETALFPFYFSPTSNYYNLIWNKNISTRDSINKLNKQISLKEWKNYLGNHIQKNAIEKLLYEGQEETYTKIKSTTQKQYAKPNSINLHKK